VKPRQECGCASRGLGRRDVHCACCSFVAISRCWQLVMRLREHLGGGMRAFGTRPAPLRGAPMCHVGPWARAPRDPARPFPRACARRAVPTVLAALAACFNVLRCCAVFAQQRNSRRLCRYAARHSRYKTFTFETYLPFSTMCLSLSSPPQETSSTPQPSHPLALLNKATISPKIERLHPQTKTKRHPPESFSER
jgi:hypothetical protein